MTDLRSRLAAGVDLAEGSRLLAERRAARVLRLERLWHRWYAA